MPISGDVREKRDVGGREAGRQGRATGKWEAGRGGGVILMLVVVAMMGFCGILWDLLGGGLVMEIQLMGCWFGSDESRFFLDLSVVGGMFTA